MVGPWSWHTKYWASVTTTVFCTFWIVVTCPVSPGTSTIRSGFCCCTHSFNWICCSRAAARRRVCCLSSCSLASSHQSAHSLLALSESAFARERAADLSDTPLVSYSGSSFLSEDQRELVIGIQAPRCAAELALVGSRRPRLPLDGDAESVSCSVVTGASSICSTVRSETRSCRITWITSAIGSNTTCGTGMSTISGTALHLWDFRGPLDLLNHCHLSLRLSCLDGRHLALHHHCSRSCQCSGPVGPQRCQDHGDMISQACWTCGNSTVFCSGESQAPPCVMMA